MLSHFYQKSSLAGWSPCPVKVNFDAAVSQECSWIAIIGADQNGRVPIIVSGKSGSI